MASAVRRIVQEEVWAQTVWPRGAKARTALILGAADRRVRAEILRRARAELGVGRLGFEG